MACASNIAKCIVITCLLWLLAFPLFGGGAWGKAAFASWASRSFFHTKSGMPILMLTFPILISASVASLMFYSYDEKSHSQRLKRRQNWGIGIVSLKKKPPEQQMVLLWLIVILPCLVYVLESARRKLTFDMSIDTALSKSGNIFGMLALVVFSWILIPVSDRGPIGRLFKWDAIKVLKFHIWGGRIIILASIIHGIEHTIRYALQGKDVLKAFYFPPVGCWTNPQTHVPEICDQVDKDEDCSCYDHFLPITGMAAVLGLILIGLTSMFKIRREHFATFALLHYVLTPLTFMAICIHYNKAILYASGSLLYYIASNVPSLVDKIFQMQSCARQSNVKIIAVEKLNSTSSKDNLQRPCVSLTMEASNAAIQQFYPGAFVYLSVPSISRISHPFSVNPVFGRRNQIRVIFRVTGPFTRALENILFSRTVTTAPLMGDYDEDEDEYQGNNSNVNYCPSVAFPRLFLDGYYGSGGLRDQISSHDLCVLVAAGIGITPYLSLLPQYVSSSHNATHDVPSDGLMIRDHQSGPIQQSRQIVLHWICRDRSLIQYCRKEYMDLGIEESQGGEWEGESISFRIIIHYTGEVDVNLDKSILSADLRQNDQADSAQYGGAPFELSKFSANGKTFDRLWYIITFFLLSWGGLWCLWRWFDKQAKTEYIHRIYTVVAVTVYGLIVAVLANSFRYLYLRRTHQTNLSTLRLNRKGDDSSIRINEMELSNYIDRTRSSPAESIPTVPMVNQNHKLPVTIELREGRPLVDSILEDLNVEYSTALFCCVPESLGKDLKEGIKRKSRFDDRCNAIPIYQESFVK